MAAGEGRAGLTLEGEHKRPALDGDRLAGVGVGDTQDSARLSFLGPDGQHENQASSHRSCAIGCSRTVARSDTLGRGLWVGSNLAQARLKLPQHNGRAAEALAR